MNNMIETKAALCGCTCPSQVYAVVDAFCSKSKFPYSKDLSMMDNSVIASRCNKQKVANVLCFAADQLERML